MPALFLNPEVGACPDKNQAVQCIARTMRAYTTLKKHVTTLCQQQNTLHTLTLYAEQGKTHSLYDLLRLADKQTLNHLRLFMQDLAKGNVLTLEGTGSKTLKGLDLPSPLLEYALEQQGMALSFANSPYWETDFLEFNEVEKRLPNVWGQTDFQPIHTWLNAYYRETAHFDGIQRMFNVVFCCDDITASTFTPYQWSLIYKAFAKAAENNFLPCPPLIKPWDGLPIFYIRDRQHSDFTLRIFFIKRKETIYVGKIYHKNASNTLKEEAAADKSYEAFCARNLFTPSTD